MAKMNTADRKGDTARGARAIVKTQSRLIRNVPKSQSRRASNGVGDLARQVTGRTGHQPSTPAAAKSKPKPAPVVAIDTLETVAPAAAEFVVREADIEDLEPAYVPILTELVQERTGEKDLEVGGKQAEEKRKLLDEQIRELFTAFGRNRINLPDQVVEECRGSSPSSISATKLLELGVDAETIAAATVPGNAYYFVKVRERSKKEQQAYDLRRSIQSASAAD